MPQQNPSVGRIVHYVSHGSPVQPDGTQAFKSECRAAIITELHDDTPDGREWVGLAVFNPSGEFFNRSPYDEWDSTEALEGAQPQGGSWHWPERI